MLVRIGSSFYLNALCLPGASSNEMQSNTANLMAIVTLDYSQYCVQRGMISNHIEIFTTQTGCLD